MRRCSVRWSAASFLRAYALVDAAVWSAPSHLSPTYSDAPQLCECTKYAVVEAVGRRLVLHIAALSDALLLGLSRHGAKLIRLELWGCAAVGDGGVAALGECGALTHLDLSRTAVGDAGVVALVRSCGELRWLSLAACGACVFC
eukprot:SAG11_NODE_8687_length_987_cov_0.981982_1_plen_144_part_00